jgi:hypothetical protein
LLEAYTEEIDNILLTYFSYLLVLSKNSWENNKSIH